MKGELGDDEWLRNEIKRVSEPDTRKQDFLNQWTSSHEGLVFTPEVQQRIRGQQEDKSALNTLVTGFLNSTKRRRYSLSVAFEWMFCAQHPYMLTYSAKKKCRYCRPIPRVGEEHPIYWKPVFHPIE